MTATATLTAPTDQQPPTPTARADQRDDRIATGRPGGRLTMVGMIRSEIIRLRLRSIRWAALLAAASIAIVGPIASFFTVRELGNVESADTLGALSESITLGMLIIGSLAAAIAGSRYSSGEIHTVLTAAPRRSAVLAAMSAVTAAGAFAITFASTLVAYAATAVSMRTLDQDVPSLFDPAAVRVVVGSAVYLSAVALAGMAFGLMLRSTAAAITVIVLGYYLLPGLASVILPFEWVQRVIDVLPSSAGSDLSSVDGGSVFRAGVLLTGWTTAVLGAAHIALTRRDA